MKAELGTCPFCGCRHIGFDDIAQVKCMGCGATCPTADAWNRRAAANATAPGTVHPATLSEDTLRDLLRTSLDRSKALGSCGMKVAADMCILESTIIKDVEYLRRDNVMELVVNWRNGFDKAACPDPHALRAVLSAPVAVTRNVPTATFAAQDFLNWNRRQDDPPVRIGKELYIAGKVLEIAGFPQRRNA